MSVKIESGIPIPPRRGVIMATLEQMNHGDSIVVPLDKINSWRSLASKNKASITTRKISEKEVRIWKVSKRKA